MWILSIKQFFTRVWEFCKKYWQILIGFAIAIVSFRLFRGTTDPSKIIEISNETHKKELDALNKAREDEQKSVDEALLKHDNTVKEIEKRYQEEKKVLTEKKREEIKKAIIESKDDPEEITRKLSEITGFQIKDS